MKLNEILKNEKTPKSIGNSGYYGLYNTFERLKNNSNIKEKEFSKYSEYFLKHVNGYTPKDLIYFVGMQIENIGSERDRKLLSEYNKAAWNQLAKKYRMEKFFENGNIGYASKLKNFLYSIKDKAGNKLSSIYEDNVDYMKNFKEYMDEEGKDKLKSYIHLIKDKAGKVIDYGVNKFMAHYNDN